MGLIKKKIYLCLALPLIAAGLSCLFVFSFFSLHDYEVYAQDVVKIPPRITPIVMDADGSVGDDSAHPQHQDLQRSEIKIVTADGANLVYTVELARTEEEKRIGMMYRSNVPSGTGMLFLFDEVREHSFWMKNTWVPLDIIFLLEDGTIHHIHHNAQPRSLEPIPSQGAVLHVLEIGGGEANRLGIAVGDQVVIN